MDDATRKALLDAYGQLMHAASLIKKLLNNEKPQVVASRDLRHASIAGVVTPEILQRSADAPALRDEPVEA